MRLVLARVAAARTLLVAAALAATVASVLLTGFLVYAEALPSAGVRAAVLDAPPAERTVQVRSSAEPDPELLDARDAAVSQLLAGPVAGVDLRVTSGGYASGQELPGEGGSAVVGFLPELPDYAELLAGDWPEPAGAGEPAQVAVPEPVAEQLALDVGDRLELVDARFPEPQPMPVEVAGRWRAADPADPYWRLLSAPLEQGVGPFVVHRDDFLDRFAQLGFLEWLAVPEPADLADAGLAEFTAGVRQLARELGQRRDTDPALDTSVRFVRLEITDLTERLAVATVVNRSGMVMPAALLAMTAGYGLVLVARLLAAHRRGENALLRARGASRWQLVRLTAAEALLVVTPAALLAAPLGTQLVLLADGYTADGALSIAPELVAYGWAGPPLAWVVALLAAAGCAAALAVPAAGRGRSWVAEQQERSRPSRAASLQRAGVDVALAALAVLAWLQLRQYGSAVRPAAGDPTGLGVDPLLVAAPVLGVLAATAAALRLLPLATRFGVRLAARRDGLPGLLGMWQADRRPHAGPVLLLVLAMATAVLAPAVASTWQQSQRDQAAHLVGADLRVSVTNPALATADELAAGVPAGSSVMPVHRTGLVLPEGGQATLLAVDSDQAPEVARLRPDLAPDGVADTFARLREGRPALSGLPLPEDASEITGRVRLTVPDLEPVTMRRPVVDEANPGRVAFEEVTVPMPVPAPEGYAVHVMDAHGAIRSVPFGVRVTDEFGQRAGGVAVGEDGWLDFSVPVPPGARWLVGLSAGLHVDGWGPDLDPPASLPETPVTWTWDGLAVDSGSQVTPLAVPDDWEVRQRGDDAEAEAEAQRVPGEPAVRTTLDPTQDLGSSLRFLLVAPPPSLGLIPIVVTPDLLEATGAEVGDTVRIAGGAGGIRSARIAGQVAAVPGTADGPGALVDLAWLSAHQFLWVRPAPAITEWWVAAAGSGDPSGLASLSWAGEVADRHAEAARLLEEPLGTGVLMALWAAAGAAALLAGFGLMVDSRATAVRRRRELAVLHTLGTAPPALARALVVEQAVLSGLGVAAGALVGVAVAATMGPSLVLTPAGQAPVPEVLLALPAGQVAVPMVSLLAAAVGLGALVAGRARREVAAGALRIGED